jgi:hypothetical protein
MRPAMKILGRRADSLSQLIACAPKLKHLTLSLDRFNEFSRHTLIVPRSLTLSCRLEFLQTLHLVNCSLQGADLADLVNAHARSLQRIILAYIRLYSGAWSSFWVTLKDVKGLHFLKITSLLEGQAPVRRRGDEILIITLDAEKSGRAMAAMLDNLIVACDAGSDLAMDGSIAH